MMEDIPTRLLVAYALIALMALTAAAVVWWNVRRSPWRVEERDRQRRRAAARLRDER